MSKRIEWVDVLKGIGIILVVLGHSIKHLSLTFDIIFSFHMPLFFFISGYLHREQTILTFVKKKANRLLIPYFFTGFFIYWYWYVITKPLTNDSSSMWAIAKIVIKSYLYGNGVGVKQFPSISAVGPLWFLPALFCSYILFYFILKITKKVPVYVNLIIMTFISYTGEKIGSVIHLPWSIDISLSSMIFMYAGYVFRNKEIEKYPKSLIPIYLILWLIDLRYGFLDMDSRSYHNFLIVIVGAISAIILVSYIAYYLSKWNDSKKILTYLGVYSMVIMVFHLMDESYFHWNLYIPWIYRSSTTLFLFRMLYSVLILEGIRRTKYLRSIYT